jgi:hypothetical protein
MPSTTFVSGTTITKEWLNEVNAFVFSGSGLSGSGIRRETIISTEGQTTFTLVSGLTYVLGIGALAVSVDGRLVRGDQVTEISNTSFSLALGIPAGIEVEAIVGSFITGGLLSDQVSFTQNGTGSVTRSATSKMQEILSPQDKGASTGTAASQTAAIQAAIAEGVPLFSRGNYRTDTALTGTYGLIALGDVTFSGSSPIDSGLPDFGTETLQVLAFGNKNGIVGTARNTLPSATLSFPTGVTGLGRNDNAGNVAFGCYFEARQYANTGVVTNEIDSFNHGAAPTNTTTGDRSIGTTHQLPNALTIGAGGTANSWLGVHVTQEGSSPQKFLYGMLFDASAVTESAIVVEATSTVGPTLPVLIKHKPASIAMQIQGVGTPVPGNAWLQYADGASAITFAVRQDGQLNFSSAISQSTVGAAGGASALPATPSGYLKFIIGSTQYVMPYFAAA